MTKQGLEILLERVASWPEDAQEEFVRSVANIESKHIGVYRLPGTGLLGSSHKN
jgi:hypothetical protein